MFVCPMAANDPSTIEAIDTNTTICCHCGTMPGNAVSATRVNTARAATFGAVAKNAVTGVGAPSYTSGVHIWNGTAETLNAIAAQMNTMPKMMPNVCAGASRRANAIFTKSVVPA